MPFQQIIMYILQCPLDIYICASPILFWTWPPYRKTGHVDELSCLYCNAQMIYMYTYFVLTSIHLICSYFVHMPHLELRANFYDRRLFKYEILNSSNFMVLLEFLAGLCVTNSTIVLVCLSVSPSVRQHFMGATLCGPDLRHCLPFTLDNDLYRQLRCRRCASNLLYWNWHFSRPFQKVTKNFDFSTSDLRWVPRCMDQISETFSHLQYKSRLSS